MVASRSRVSRRTSTKPSNTHISTLAFRNTCELLESRCSKYGFLAHDTTGAHTTSEKKNTRVPDWVLRQFWLRKKGEARNSTKKLKAQSGSWCKVDSCDVHRNTCDISLNEKVCHSIEKKESMKKLEHSQTLYRISSSQREHTLIFEVNPTLLKGQSRDISVVEFFFENANRSVWNEFEWSEYRDDTCG